jgi:hypothetical protein
MTPLGRERITMEKSRGITTIEKETKLLELKKDFEEFVKQGAINKGLNVNRIVFDLDSLVETAIEILKNVEEDNLYRLEFLLNFYIPEGVQATFSTIYDFRTNKLKKELEVTLLSNSFDYSLSLNPASLKIEIRTHRPIFSKDFLKEKYGDKILSYFVWLDYERYYSTSIFSFKILLDYTFDMPKIP